ncbi:MAG: glycosyltransferase [Rhizobiales bacterium]|nr:glycosyltransferase [Hyphomicrobiales bacterium]NRB14950.1 glycosyltransferase [Hyphomicrobiales bacterium]
MKNILFLVSTLRNTGPTNQLSYILKYMDKELFKPHILTLSEEPKDSRKNYFEDELKLNIISLRLSRIKGFFKAKAKIRNFIIENNIDLIHSQGLRADSLLSKLNVNTPRISTIRNYPQSDYPMMFGKLLGNFLAVKHISALRNLDNVFGVSDSVSNNLKNEYGLTNIQTVRNGVDISKYKPCIDKIQLKKELSIPLKKTIWISSIGKGSRKDSTIIARAFKKIHEADNSNFLIFVGDGELKIQCQKILEGINNTLFTGNISNISKYLQIANFFISSSKAEGFPNAVLEAMACGLPAILSNIAPHTEIISLNKKSAISFKLGSTQSLVDAMENIVDINSNISTEEAINLIDTQLTADKMSRNYQAVYQELIH